jgi:hypothetical protein
MGTLSVARSLCVSIHVPDAAAWSQCTRLEAAVREVGGVPLTWLLVPDRHGRGPRLAPELREALDARFARGDELALHGWHHRDDSPPPVAIPDRIRRRLRARGEGEFAALPEIEARARLIRGREWFMRQGWPLAGFVPPAGLLSNGAARAVCALGFEYTITVGKFHALGARRTLRAPCLRWRAEHGMPALLAMAWNEALSRAVARGAILRIALHPSDASSSRVVRHAQRVLEVALRDRAALTHASLARALSAEGAIRLPSAEGTARVLNAEGAARVLSADGAPAGCAWPANDATGQPISAPFPRDSVGKAAGPRTCAR